MFNIEFINSVPTSEEKKENSFYCRISVGDFTEEFLASMSYWDRSKYEKQWAEGLFKIIQGEAKSCLVACMYDPENANFISIWSLYNLHNAVVVQNNLIFIDELDTKFNERNLYLSIPERETVTEDGEPISEWYTSKEEIMDYLKAKGLYT